MSTTQPISIYRQKKSFKNLKVSYFESKSYFSFLRANTHLHNSSETHSNIKRDHLSIYIHSVEHSAGSLSCDVSSTWVNFITLSEIFIIKKYQDIKMQCNNSSPLIWMNQITVNLEICSELLVNIFTPSRSLSASAESKLLENFVKKVSKL